MLTGQGFNVQLEEALHVHSILFHSTPTAYSGYSDMIGIIVVVRQHAHTHSTTALTAYAF